MSHELIELTDAELDFVGGGVRHRSSTRIDVKVEFKNIGNHNGNGNTVDIGNDNGLSISVSI